MHESAIADRLVLEIAKCDERLKAINDALGAELQKPILRRQRSLLLFLYKEKAVYDFAVKLLRSIETGA